MSVDQLNIVLVGAAGKVAAPAHLNGLENISNANIYGVCDVDPDAVSELAERYGAKRFTSIEEVLADPEVDAVDLVTPPFLHAEQTIASAKAGKHVYCEKPMTRSLGEADAMVAAHNSSGTTLMIGESYVFHHPNVAARKVIESGDIGDILHIREIKGVWVIKPEESQRLSGLSHEANAPWRVDPQLSGGGQFPWIMDHAPHFFATARYFAGGSRVRGVTAHSKRMTTDSDATSGTGAPTGQAITSVSWDFESGIDATWNQIESNPNQIEEVGFVTRVYGSQGSMIVFGEGGGAGTGMKQPPAVLLVKDGRTKVIDEGNSDDRVWVSNNNYYDASHQAALQHWVDSIQVGKPVRYSGEEGREELAATLATLRSAIDSRSVSPVDVSTSWTAY